MNVSMPIATPSPNSISALVARPELRLHLERYVRRRVPAADVEDTVQSILCAALESRRAPTEMEELRKWITGVARHKIAAHWARSQRETLDDAPEAPTAPAPLEAASIAKWAEKQASFCESEHVEQTLDWMAREADGEELERIAHEANLPAARVRQRVSRMRRWMRARWAAELAAVAAIVLLALAIAAWWALGGRRAETAKEKIGRDVYPHMGAPSPSAPPPPPPAPSPTPSSAPPHPAPSATPTHHATTTTTSTAATPRFTGTGTAATPGTH